MYVVAMYSLCVWESCASFAHLNADEQIVNQKKFCNPILKVIVRPYSRRYTHTYTLSVCLSFNFPIIDYFGRLCQCRVEFGKKVEFLKEFASLSCEFLSFSFCVINECHSMFFDHSDFCDMQSNWAHIFSILKWKVVLMIIQKIFCWLCVIGCTRTLSS